MQPLDKTYRNLLERKVKEARDIAEAAAGTVLAGLGVGDVKPFDHLNDAERHLRRRLRAHGRQLGDLRKAGGEQETSRLGEEVAYEHWHRMLFARFLAENDLLMYPDPDDPVAISLEECEDLAADEGAKNGWELAARYASQMLPQIFRLDSPVFELNLPPEHQQRLERLLADLPVEVFTASDSLGWVYQFWQAKKKDEVNASEVKIGARELPAVTQLFTEPYMVSFLLDNSLGSWWAARRLPDNDFESAAGEEELRSKASIPGVPLKYLRFVQQEGGVWAPAAGTFSSWPEKLSELKTLDPCCGSGHFLVAAFLMLVPMRMELERLSARDAVDAVLRQNIHGLELDQRCVELAAFALALTAWKYPDAGGYRSLPELHVACSGLSMSVAKDEWKKLGVGKKNLAIALGWMHDTFMDAPVLGSLLDPTQSDATKLVEWDELSSALELALVQEQRDVQQEAIVVAQGLVKAAILLAKKYHWVITNVPYLSSRKQDDKLKNFCSRFFDNAKNDLAAVFVSRIKRLLASGGSTSLVCPQYWLFKSSYSSLRKELLTFCTWDSVVRLGTGAFETITGEVVNVALVTFSLSLPSKENQFIFIDATSASSTDSKAEIIGSSELHFVSSASQLENPGCKIVGETIQSELLLKNYAIAPQGIKTGDDEKWRRRFWEVPSLCERWEFYQSTVSASVFFGGRSLILDWNSKGLGMIRPRLETPAINKVGVAVSQSGKLPVTIYLGQRFDSNVAPLVVGDAALLPALWAYCASGDYHNNVRAIDQSMKVTNVPLTLVPFQEKNWSEDAKKRYPYGLPNPFSDDPTQWIFHGHPCGSVIWNETSKWTAHGPLRTDSTVLHIAIARLLGYRWPAELAPCMELADEQREWVNRCETLLPFTDEDGIACIPPVRGEASAADRLLNLLAAAYGDAWSTDILAQLLKSTDHAGKSLETWLRDKFFTQHSKLFHHRPFIWHIWDGLQDGFSALVNYHKFDAKLMETLIYTYLGDWITRQKQDIDAGVDGAQGRLAAAESLKKKLELILEGESPHDIFVRWKSIDKQPIGWNPDLGDGVRLNIRPFLTVGDVKKKNAGLFPFKPNIKWSKDRGKDVSSAPWYQLGLQYNGKEGDRINDHHLTLAEKQASKEETCSE